ncbi:MAG: 4Fe-4S dicluster domain-containing protein, partial [Provencibacterium sp.]|nr:4Fe-4S dicluster domain-containing protein [Provencibacterium sp.]
MGRDFKIELASPQSCTGCAACAASCPSSAIRMQPDSLGFAVPQIDRAQCTECERCMKTCPVLYPVPLNPEPVCYAVQAENDLRLVSSSGGAFSLLAQEIIRQGGAVCGAAFDEKFLVRHVFAEDEAGLAAMRGSKYLQSDVGDTYAQTKTLLEKGRSVLYSGCPCQIAGLYRFLNEDYERLYTVDLLCLGVPSPRFFKEYLALEFPPNAVEEVSFRNKAHGQGWTSDSLMIRTGDGGEHSYNASTSSYEACFQHGVFLRESCYRCPYNTKDRAGDLSLGDFWGIEAYDPSLNDNRGTSMVLVNTQRGRELFERIRPAFKRVEQAPLECSPANRLHENPLKQSEERLRFLDLYPRLGYRKAAEYAGFRKYDVGIIGCWSVENHGSNLTYYALYQTIKDMGLEPLMIERPANSPWPPRSQAEGFSVSPYQPWELAPIFPDRGSMRALNRQCETFLLGSDQLFFHELYTSFGEFADLGYINQSKRKVAYGASVGRTSFSGTEAQREKLAYFLGRFDAVSVREADAVDLFADTFGVKAQAVLDPVFLCNLEDYQKMAAHGKKVSDKPYIAVYMLDPSAQKERALQAVSQAMDLPCRIFSDVAHTQEQVERKWNLPSITAATNEDWLRALMDSEFVITDSFHGTCFSILFQKPFLCIANPFRGQSRFSSLLNLLGLESRMVEELDEETALQICKQPLDYSLVLPRLDKEAARSRLWLEQALRCPHNKSMSGYDLLDERVNLLEPAQAENRRRGIATEKWLLNTHQRVDALEGLYQRVDALEGLYQRVDALEGLYRRVDALEGLYQRMDALEGLYQRVDALEGLYQRVDALVGLYPRVDALEGLYQRMDALEGLYQRVDALEGLY